jgi:hypothetical protein
VLALLEPAVLELVPLDPALLVLAALVLPLLDPATLEVEAVTLELDAPPAALVVAAPPPPGQPPRSAQSEAVFAQPITARASAAGTKSARMIPERRMLTQRSRAEGARRRSAWRWE